MVSLTSSHAGTVRRLGLGAAAALAAVVLIAVPTARAHSGVQSTSPRAGAVVKALPATITITFGDRLIGVTGVRVIDARGVNHTASARLDPRNAARVVVRTTAPVAGAYRVMWTVRSEDGHSASGTFGFRARGA